MVRYCYQLPLFGFEQQIAAGQKTDAHDDAGA